MTMVHDTVAEIKSPAKQEAPPAAELSEDSKIVEEVEVPIEADENEAAEDDGIHVVFLCHIH